MFGSDFLILNWFCIRFNGFKHALYKCINFKLRMIYVDLEIRFIKTQLVDLL